MTPEEMEKLAKELARLSGEDLEELLASLENAAGLSALAGMVAAAKAEASGAGGGGESEDEALAALERLSQDWGAGIQPAMGPGLGPTGMPGAGGEATRAPDAGEPERDDRVKGKLDPKGRLDPASKFRGLPKPGDAEEVFHETVLRAAQDAEEGLGRDPLPAAARPFVKRYFDALKGGAGEGK